MDHLKADVVDSLGGPVRYGQVAHVQDVPSGGCFPLAGRALATGAAMATFAGLNVTTIPGPTSSSASAPRMLAMSAGTCTCPSADGTTRTRRRTSVPAICKLYDELWLDRSTPELMPFEVGLVKRSSHVFWQGQCFCSSRSQGDGRQMGGQGKRRNRSIYMCRR